MKKIILAVILSISAILQTAVFAENDEITVTINGETLESPIPEPCSRCVLFLKRSVQR